MGKGEALTEIAQRGENPYRFVEFKTAWDRMTPEPESVPAESARSYDDHLREAAEAGKFRTQERDKGRDR